MLGPIFDNIGTSIPRVLAGRVDQLFEILKNEDPKYSIPFCLHFVLCEQEKYIQRLMNPLKDEWGQGDMPMYFNNNRPVRFRKKEVKRRKRKSKLRTQSSVKKTREEGEDEQFLESIMADQHLKELLEEEENSQSRNNNTKSKKKKKKKKKKKNRKWKKNRMMKNSNKKDWEPSNSRKNNNSQSQQNIINVGDDEDVQKINEQETKEKEEITELGSKIVVKDSQQPQQYNNISKFPRKDENSSEQQQQQVEVEEKEEEVEMERENDQMKILALTMEITQLKNQILEFNNFKEEMNKRNEEKMIRQRKKKEELLSNMNIMKNEYDLKIETKDKEMEEKDKEIENQKRIINAPFTSSPSQTQLSMIENLLSLETLKTEKKKRFEEMKKNYEKSMEWIRLRETEIEVAKGEEKILCKICFVRECQSAIIPCGHVLCPICIEKIQDRCPFCRNNVEGKMKIFIS